MKSSLLRGLLLALTATGTFASPVKVQWEYKVKDAYFVPNKWERRDAAPKDHILNLQIGLKQTNGDQLTKHLYEVSDPSHSRYGQHFTIDQLNELTKPSDQALSDVQEWLQEVGVDLGSISWSKSKDWINVAVPVELAERLLDTEYSIWEHADGTKMVRTPEWSLPAHLHEHITAVQPTNSFAKANMRTRASHRRRSLETRDTAFKPVTAIGEAVETPEVAAFVDAVDASVSSACSTSSVTPTCLRTLYGTINYTVQAPTKNFVAINDFLGESNRRSDIQSFLTQYRPDAVSEANSFTFVSINGGTTSQTLTQAQISAGTDLEGNLDAETIIGIDYPMKMTAYTTGGTAPDFTPDKATPSNTNEPYLAWVQYVLNQTSIPQTISTSYDDDEQTVPFSYASVVCDEFRKLGLLGVSLFFASGDDGVGTAGDCVSNNGSSKSTFLPEFPSSCPYVTSVGATKNFNPEVAAYDSGNAFAPGGGFSNYFARPSYQDAFIPAYITSLKGEYAGMYNTSGRGIPDIAAQGQDFATIWDGQYEALDGTSAATPTAAGVIALVNDALIAAGKSPLGFLNPWLYSGGYKAFNDITSGSSRGCGVAGFPAQTGWDAVTGFGTPNFPSILSNLGV